MWPDSCRGIGVSDDDGDDGRAEINTAWVSNLGISLGTSVFLERDNMITTFQLNIRYRPRLKDSFTKKMPSPNPHAIIVIYDAKAKFRRTAFGIDGHAKKDRRASPI
jgi:hypothetical protein